MITSNLGDNYSSNMVKAKVELYNGSTLAAECTCGGYLSDFKISREGELGKFFGFGVCHSLEMRLIDLNKSLKLYEGYTAKVCLGNGTIFDCPYPDLEVTSVVVDKKSGDIKITAFDPLHRAAEFTFSDIGINPPYSLRELTEAIAGLLGLTLETLDDSFELTYETKPNYNDDESIRLILNHIAEVTQTIYYVNNNNKLVFKRLDASSVNSYDRQDYYEFETAEHKVIKGICSATELGENYIYSDYSIENGVIQYVRDNGLWELREDVTTLVEQGVERISGLDLYQFELDWTGDYRLEIGDCISIIYEDDVTDVFVLNDVIEYAGTLSEMTSWEYKDSDTDTFANPTNLSDKINQTFAKVDKIEQNITLYVGEIVKESIDDAVGDSLTEIEEKITQLELTTEGINATVKDLSSNSATKTYVDEQILEAAGDAQDYTDAEVTKTVTLINTKVSEINQTAEGITQRVSAQETKTTELDSAINALDTTVTEHTESLTQLQLNTDSISASVSTLTQSTTDSVNALNNEISSLSKQVSASITSEDVTIAIQSELENGIGKVKTSTGYTFDADGLHISKSSSQMESTLNEDGLTVSRYDAEVLTAKADGVNALNITVRQYFKIGGSRFESMGSDRVGCFWVGE